MRTAPSLPFDDVKSQKAGTAGRVVRFLELTPIRIGPEQGAASAERPVRLQLYHTGKGVVVGKSGEWRVVSDE